MSHDVINLTLDDDVAPTRPPPPRSLSSIASLLKRSPRPAFESPRASRIAGSTLPPAHAVHNNTVRKADSDSDDDVKDGRRRKVASKDQNLVRREPYRALQPAPPPGNGLKDASPTLHQNRAHPPFAFNHSFANAAANIANNQHSAVSLISADLARLRSASNHATAGNSHSSQSPLAQDAMAGALTASLPRLDGTPSNTQYHRVSWNAGPEASPQPLKRPAEDRPSPQALLQSKRPKLSDRTQDYLHQKLEKSRTPPVMQSIESGPRHATPKLEPARATQPMAPVPASASASAETTSRHGLPYSKEEDALLVRLRQADVPWPEIPAYFNGRTSGSLQVRFSSKLAHLVRPQHTKLASPGFSKLANDHVETEVVTKRRTRKSMRIESPLNEVEPNHDHDSTATPEADEILPESRTTAPKVSASKVLRHRELGTSRTSGSTKQNLVDLKEYSLSTLGGSKYLDDTSGDVSAVAWSSDGQTFAAGGVVLSDPSSMQYNKPRNLLLGKPQSKIIELADHYIPRSTPDSGVNALPSMQASQDPRLFTTVQMVGFSKDDRYMFSASIDGNVNAYQLGMDVEDSKLLYQIHHAAPVDLLSISNHGCIATGSRTTGKGCIKVFRTYDDTADEIQSIGPIKQPDTMFPSALKWGVAPNQTNFLLAGFTQESQREYEEDETMDLYGEVCLYDGTTGQHLSVEQNGRSVFDVAWNPNLGHTAFAVASVGSGKLNKGMHSVVKLFAERDNSLKSVVELECPARDINDVVYCPYDENLVAAGSTDGKVYVWDTRYVKTAQTPHRRLAHGGCIGILEHDRPRWEVDTGIRFLQWGSTHTTLFSGSSDSVVKRWNPYLAPEDSHVYDVFTGKAAIMSGAFNPDYSRLLIGEDGGRLNMLEVGHEDNTIADMQRFKLISAPEPAIPEEVPAHRELLETVQHPDLQYNITFGMHGAQNQGYNTEELMEKHAQAAAFQKKLHRQRKDWKKLKQTMPFKVEPCTLDCAFLPRKDPEDPDQEVQDSKKSLSRIADELRCEPPEGFMARRYRGLLAKCRNCLAPAPPPERDDATETYCVKCRFECFRCGQPASLRVGENIVQCFSCEITWDIGALGYDIVGQTIRKMDGITLDDDKTKDGSEEQDSGDELRRHYLDMGT
ncbi:hypothetical protein MBLNU457_7056t2 [Dothideomycetes sp. NU457]